MKNFTPIFFLFALVCLVTKPLAAAGQESVEATVVKITGRATALVPGKSEPVVLLANAKLPAGSVITTEAGAEVHVQPFSGSVATIKENSTVGIEELSETKNNGVVTKQKTLLNLRSGNLVSTIDPAKKAVTDYGVRTPKGVAAARGTSFSISVVGEAPTIIATADTVTFRMSSGASYSIVAGQVVITAPNGEPQPAVSLASAMASNPGLSQIISNAVVTLAEVVSEGLGNISSSSATNLASQLVAVAAAADPAQAGVFAQTLATAFNASGSADSAASIAAVTASAVTAAPGQAANIASTVAGALPAQLTGLVTAAAIQAAPGAEAAIVSSVAASTGQSAETVQNAAQSAASQAAAAIGDVVNTVTTGQDSNTGEPLDTTIISPSNP